MKPVEFRKAIQKWAEEQLNPLSTPHTVLVIRAFGEGVRPNSPYVTYHIMTNTKLGGTAYQSGITNIDEATPNGVQNVRWDEDIVVSFQSYGLGSENFLKILRSSLEKTSVLDYFDRQDIVIRSSEAIQDISEILDDTAEPRWSWDVTFGIGEYVQDSPGYILDVDYEGEYEPAV
jgi:hypothetical protein